ncbi:MAG: LPS export ABC transporter periplasmic protein LptC [Mariprofundaceae bacterium]|nr:LPS export ABC transporter periplasmic protein LptC [Mariprofundaceae bacterium]
MFSIASLLLAAVLMMTSKQSLKQLVDVVAMTTGTSIKNLDMSEYDGERLQWHLYANSAVEEGDVVKLSMPALDLYTHQGEVMPIRALRGVYDQQAEVMHFEGEVRLDFSGWTLHSEKVDFDERKDEVWVPEYFVFSTDDMRITGENMQVSRKTATIYIWGGVRMEMEGLE